MGSQPSHRASKNAIIKVLKTFVIAILTIPITILLYYCDIHIWYIKLLLPLPTLPWFSCDHEDGQW